jgi:hypothetical protein
VTDGRPELVGLALADPVARWRDLGFAVGEDRRFTVGGVVLEAGGGGRGITGWTIRGLRGEGAIDGLATTVSTAEREPSDPQHPNGAVAVDHVVVVTPAFDRLSAVLDARGLTLRRVRQAGERRQGFRRLGMTIMEIVEAPEADAPAFWGLTFTVADLGALAARLGPLLGEARDAVQPGRRIATVRREAGLTTAVAFMDPG